MFLKLILPIIICFLPLIVTVILLAAVKKIKLSKILIVILLGLVAVVPISFVQFFIPDLKFSSMSPILYTIIKCVILYGLVEEVLKTAVLIPVVGQKNKLFDNLMIGILFGLTVGCSESVVYYLDHLQKSLDMEGKLLYFQIFLRIFTTDIIHGACAGLGGLFVYSCKMKKPKISCILGAILLHGFYDFFVSFQLQMAWLRYFAIAVILLAVLECRIKYNDIKDNLEGTDLSQESLPVQQ